MNITLSVFRKNKRNKGEYRTYSIPFRKGLTVLDALLYIHKSQDPTLGFRYECRSGICGTCGVMLNDKPVLSCSTRLDPKIKKNVIKPLANFKTENDLIADLAATLKRYKKVKPYLSNIKNVVVPLKEANTSKPFRKCIECGCCIAASKTFAQHPSIVDPMGAVKLARFLTDPRDGLDRKAIAKKAGGVEKYNDTEAKKLADVCPRRIPIDTAIKLLKSKK